MVVVVTCSLPILVTLNGIIQMQEENERATEHNFFSYMFDSIRTRMGLLCSSSLSFLLPSSMMLLLPRLFYVNKLKGQISPGNGIREVTKTRYANHETICTVWPLRKHSVFSL